MIKIFLSNININENHSYNVNNSYLLREEIIEKRKLLKYLISITIFLGSLGFIISSISSYLKITIVPFLYTNEIIFFPQGITMGFYGILGLILSINQLFILYWKIGVVLPHH